MPDRAASAPAASQRPRGYQGDHPLLPEANRHGLEGGRWGQECWVWRGRPSLFLFLSDLKSDPFPRVWPGCLNKSSGGRGLGLQPLPGTASPELCPCARGWAAQARGGFCASLKPGPQTSMQHPPDTWFVHRAAGTGQVQLPPRRWTGVPVPGPSSNMATASRNPVLWAWNFKKELLHSLIHSSD